MTDRNRVADENLLRVVVGVGWDRVGVVVYGVGGRIGGEAAQTSKNGLEPDVDIRVDADGDEEDGDTPAVGKGVAKIETTTLDPAPVAAHVAVGSLKKTNSAC